LAKRYPGNAQLEKIVVDSSKDVLQADALEDFLPFSSRTALLDRVHQYEPSYKASSQYSYPSAGKQSGCGTGIIVFIIVCLFIGIVVFVHSVLN
ncbi:MAG: hypothetical protein IKD70_00180, partial [Eggerthellaceae bacterium]|nr:hypothetical protein [Eggerthellaceae bacterium]